MKTILTHTLAAFCLSAFASADDDHSLDSCPPAVRDAVRNNLHGGTLEEIETRRKGGETIYVAEIHPAGRDRDDDDDLKIHIGADGRILKTREDIPLREAPDAVKEALRSFGGEIDDLDRETRDGAATYHAEIGRKGRPDLEVIISADGRVLREIPDKDDDGDDDGDDD